MSERMVEVADALLASQPDDVDMHILAAIGLNRLGRVGEADGHLSQAQATNASQVSTRAEKDQELAALLEEILEAGG
ncbi:MAG TPA: hypothetical protein VGC54_10135 [Planctomycetota bacterium]